MSKKTNEGPAYLVTGIFLIATAILFNSFFAMRFSQIQYYFAMSSIIGLGSLSIFTGCIGVSDKFSEKVAGAVGR